MDIVNMFYDLYCVVHKDHASRLLKKGISPEDALILNKEKPEHVSSDTSILYVKIPCDFPLVKVSEQCYQSDKWIPGSYLKNLTSRDS